LVLKLLIPYVVLSLKHREEQIELLIHASNLLNLEINPTPQEKDTKYCQLHIEVEGLEYKISSFLF